MMRMAIIKKSSLPDSNQQRELHLGEGNAKRNILFMSNALKGKKKHPSIAYETHYVCIQVIERNQDYGYVTSCISVPYCSKH